MRPPSRRLARAIRFLLAFPGTPCCMSDCLCAISGPGLCVYVKGVVYSLVRRRLDGRKNTPLLCLTLGMPLWGWAGSATSGAATRTVGPLPGEHPRPAVVPSLGATAMEIRCTQISGFVDYCSLSVQSQRQRPCLENESQCCCVGGLSRGACSIRELRWRAGRSMHSSRASCRKSVFRPPVSSSLPEW